MTQATVANPNPPLISNTVIDVGQITVANAILTDSGVNLNPGYAFNAIYTVPTTATGLSSGNTLPTILGNTILPVNALFVFNAISATQINYQLGAPSNILLGTLTSTNSILGAWTIAFGAGDSNTLADNSLTTSTDSLTINPALVAAVALTSSGGNTIDLGQSKTLLARPSGGTTNGIVNGYIYQWYTGSSTTCSSDSAITGATSNTYVATPLSTNTYCYKITDFATTNVVVSSPTNAIVVSSVIQPTLQVNSSTVYFGTSVILTANVIGGSGSYTYTFSDSNHDSLSSCTVSSTTSTNAMCTDSPLQADTYTISITDSNGASNSITNTVSVVANPLGRGGGGGGGGVSGGGSASTTTVASTIPTTTVSSKPTVNVSNGNSTVSNVSPSSSFGVTIGGTPFTITNVSFGSNYVKITVNDPATYNLTLDNPVLIRSNSTASVYVELTSVSYTTKQATLRFYSVQTPVATTASTTVATTAQTTTAQAANSTPATTIASTQVPQSSSGIAIGVIVIIIIIVVAVFYYTRRGKKSRR
ncbi:MAG: hypothetical protein KGH61_01300 [Candidatus Micrarchaeota archaeon]|nr:hypothetical protein [Candidatus Micrarchaeota archaeon]MDE1847568.1 hypothetical protein [Candidatus Micrarchaeota archaeon]MDE1864285.1 hypothetical protein [Candidatus Micrarchaeota archaeon]